MENACEWLNTSEPKHGWKDFHCGWINHVFLETDPDWYCLSLSLHFYTQLTTSKIIYATRIIEVIHGTNIYTLQPETIPIEATKMTFAISIQHTWKTFQYLFRDVLLIIQKSTRFNKGFFSFVMYSSPWKQSLFCKYTTTFFFLISCYKGN